MKRLFYAIVAAAIVILGTAIFTHAASVFSVQQGGTGTTTAPTGQLIYGGKSALTADGKAYQSVATTSATCSGSVSCTGFTVIGSSPITLTGSAAASFPFDPHVGYNSTSTVIGFNGLFSTASSSFSGPLFVQTSRIASTTAIVCKDSTACDYTTIGAAITAGWRDIFVKDGTYAEQITIANTKTKLRAQSLNTIIQCNGSTQSPCVTLLDETTIDGFTFNEANGQLVGVAISASDHSLTKIINNRVNNFATSTQYIDTANATFYNTNAFNTYFGTGTCWDFGGTQANANWVSNNRCRPMSAVDNTYGAFVSDARGVNFIANDVEGTTTGKTSVGYYFDATSRDDTVTGGWDESLGTGVKIATGANNISFNGTNITSHGTDITDTGTNSSFIAVNRTGTKLFQVPSLTIGSLTGALSAASGVVSAGTLSVANGGTNAISFTANQPVVSDAAGTQLVSSSTLTVNVGGTGATSFTAGNRFIITAGGTAPFTSIALPLSIANGGTGTTTSRNQGIWYSDGIRFVQASSTALLDYDPTLQQFTAKTASTSNLSVNIKAYFGGTATTTIDSAGNIVIPSGSSLTNTGVTNGCGTWASGVLGSTGIACVSGGGIADPFTHAAGSATTSALGIGTTTPFSQLSVSTSTQTVNTVSLFAVASTTNDTLLNVLGSGNVGVGTTTPGTLFSINGSANFTTGTSTILGNGLKATQLNATASSSFNGFSILTGGFTIDTLLSCSSPKALTTDGSGNVICGTISAAATPGGASSTVQYNANNVMAGSSKFIWNGTYAAIGSTTAGSVNAQYLPGVLTLASSTAPEIALSDGIAGDSAWTINSISNALFFATTTALGLSTSTVAALTIDKNSQFGFGTSTPGTAFSIQGVGNFSVATSTFYGNGVGAVRMNSTSSSTFAGVQSTGGFTDTTLISCSGTKALQTGAAGDFVCGVAGIADPFTHATAIGSSATTTWLGLGTTTPGYQLSISTTTASATPFPLLSIASSTNGTLFNVLTNGFVGIATSSPWTAFTIDRSGTVASTSLVVTEYVRNATSTAMTISAKDGNQQDLRIGTAGVTITLDVQTFLPGQKLILTVCNPNAVAGAITWATANPTGGLLWSGGTAPTQTTVANKCDIWSFLGTQATSTSAGTTAKLFGAQTANF